MAKSPKNPPQKKPNKDQKEKLQKGLNEAGQKAISEAINPELKAQAEIMARRLNKIDEFVESLKETEAEDGNEISPKEITEVLMLKARHNAFVHTADADNSRVLLWLIELVLFNADAIFSVTKAHLLAQKGEENAENMQKQEKKSPKKPKRA